ncbi:MAG: glycerate kinase [Pseudomonadota bacterium]
MKILFAPDSFKGTMSSIKVIELLKDAASKHFTPLETVDVPIADGGEGTVDSLKIATGGEYRHKVVSGPLGQPVKAMYGIINGDTAVIEMAQASGITLIKDEERNPLLTTTYGTGELIKEALDLGIRKFIVGIGGSATNDGGIGAAQALGISFLDDSGKEVGYGGQQLSKISKILVNKIDPRIKESSFIVICDVSNPLTGESGATAVYGPQKGATKEMLEILESGMKNYASVIKDTIGQDIDKMPGAGAAGGLGAALMAFFGARLKPGIETILEIVNFDKLLEGVDLVITGEGRIDGQSVYGKVPVGVASHCRKKGIKVVAIVGSMGQKAENTYEFGIDSIMTAINKDMELREALSRSEELLKDAADRMFRMIKVGMSISQSKSN